jgi:hypothetical protein
MALVGFAFSYLLGFKLLPRMKRIAHQKLVKADADDQVPSCLTGMVADKPITGGGVLFQPCTIPRSEGLLMQRL